MIKALIPSVLREILHRLKMGGRHFQYVRNLKKSLLEVPKEGIFINYGGVLPQTTNGLITGGKVKLINLREFFPENPNRFNLLYLVSSAQPLFSEALVRWAKDHGAKFVLNQNGVAYPA